ncbi:hypothetical protein EDF56_103177 [Novosphingobium sp. PhB165]|nr:hypothetical protein EDF56_103177 [Novosphingobium sp. PhB165]
MPRELLVRVGAFLDKGLNESALFLRPFPGERLLASGDLDHQIADALGLARLHHQVLRQVVALVEDAERDHAVLVRRAELLALRGLRRTGLHAGNGIGDRGILRLRRGLALATGGQRQRQGKHLSESERPLHARAFQASGDQAS